MTLRVLSGEVVENFLVPVAVTVGAAVAALIAVTVIYRVVRRLGRRSVLLAELARHAHRPFRVTLLMLAVQFAVRFTTYQPGTGRRPEPEAAGLPVAAPWRETLLHILVLAVIAAFAWLSASLLMVAEELALVRFRDTEDSRQARRIKTQVVMLRRLAVAVVVLLAVGAMLMTFPSVRGIGASVLASAGLAGVIAGLAAQSLLGNVFAGLQLAFSDALRLDDVVVVEGEYGRIEEITLSYVVVRIWDERRLVLPTSYFTTKPFQNWTRNRSEVTGTAEFDVDWTVSVESMRQELRRVVESTDLWDGRVCNLQVTDATGGVVRVRAVVSAANASHLWDLRCLVRERMVGWIREQTALPRMRAEVGDPSVEELEPPERSVAHDGEAPKSPTRAGPPGQGQPDADEQAPVVAGPAA